VIRVGILGTGAVSRGHVAALSQLPGTRLTAFVDPLLERAMNAAREHDARAFATLDEALDLVDAVWVCAPPHLHAELAVTAARSGKHVFVEKPMAHTLAAADTMIAAAAETGVKLMVGQSVRFGSAARTIRRLVTDGVLGDLVACWSRRHSAPDAERINGYPGWRRDWRQGGGFTIEWGIHEVDFVRWIGEAAGGRIERVSGEVRFTRPDQPHFDTYVRAILHFSNGVVGSIDGGASTPLADPTARAAVGTRGMAVYAAGGVRVRLVGEREDHSIEQGEGTEVGDGKLTEDRLFLEAISQNVPPPVTGEDARTSLALCLAIHEASRSRQAVHV
jgi:predicted dehydrogenase